MSKQKELQEKQEENEWVRKEKIGQGSFGEVFRIETRDGATRALKVVLERKKYMNRELSTLQKLDHPNIIKMISYSHGEQVETGRYLHLVLEYLPEDLQALIRKRKFSRKEILVYAEQLLSALEYMHSKSIAHRDIKPSNILVDAKKKELKICDLGSAKEIKAGEKNVLYICSRHYRAPEVHRKKEYTTKMDVWSAGCIIAEMLTQKVLLENVPTAASPGEILAKVQALDAEVLAKNGNESADILAVLKLMLEMNADLRIDAKTARKHFINLQDHNSGL